LFVSIQKFFSDDLNDFFVFFIFMLIWVGDITGLGKDSFEFSTFMDEESSISTIINEEIWTISIWPCESFVCADPVFF
jgi:hypothetical protein